MDKYSPLLEEEDEEVTENERELEALAIAGRIRSMVGHERVLDKETGVSTSSIWRYRDPAPICFWLG
ncbi:MAG: hypothetical protein ACLUI0_03085 [Blautia massiliensis (ex Durand et al. 2017)]